jgi:hypothetical protein
MADNTFDNPGRIGRRVLYCLAENDVHEIVQKRRASGSAQRSGNDPREGQVYPGLIVADFFAPLKISDLGPEGTEERLAILNADRLKYSSANLQVFLDGNDSHWPTSRQMYDPAQHYTLRGEEPQEKVPNPKGRWIFAD